VKLALTDAGSGVDAGSIDVKIDGRVPATVFSRGVLQVSGKGLRAGTHRIRLVVSDYEEAKNMENVGPILPNTRTFTGTFVVG
jgi:hypothetical protein